MRKTILKSAILLSIILFSCSNEKEEIIDNSAVNIENFEKNLLSFVNLPLEGNNLALRLDYSGNYQNINSIILRKSLSKEKNDLVFSENSNHSINLFDKHIVKNILKSLTEDDVVTFFNRMEFYQEFVDNNIVDLSNKEYLTKNISEFKWIKYSIQELKGFDSLQQRGFDACFDFMYGT